MNRWTLSVATLAAFGLLSLNAAAQSSQDNKPPAGDTAKQTATADSQDSSKPMTDAEKKAADKKAKEDARKEAKQKASAEKPKSDDQKRKDPDAIGDRDVGKGVNFYSLD